MSLRGIFWLETEGRLRAGWRILLQILLLVVLGAAVTTPLRSTLRTLPREHRAAVLVVLVAVLATLSVWACRRWLNRRTLTSLGLRWSRTALADLFFGFGLSALLVGFVFGVEWAAGWIAVGEAEDSPRGAARLGLTLYGLFATGLIVAWWEELVFRGYWLQNLRDGLGLRWAIAISVVIYGLIHLANPGAGALSAVMISAIGVTRIYGWVSTRQLWLSMGMHAGWNFFQGPIFGFGTSGHRIGSLLATRVEGPSWITGGSFGPEGGLITLPTVLLALGAMYLWTRRRRGVAGP